nr:immunoglobulin heavy chain junction region [Macaca mulatta]MOW45541.1 immunoglobulin heavy chain junction region [Macaca mulatta]MOW45601.1 immunoglobulin heavy chain junction region [Macaca mulatta]MOW45711.1 immunoglobulin heavy chain junction region [Macaca mulatta]MOW45724.1 immunoglobulin heavy chain junction region [Macaca mulatta]
CASPGGGCSGIFCYLYGLDSW